MGRIVAVLTGCALLACAWWMTDRNHADPAGEFSFDLLVAAPPSMAQVATIISVGTDDAGDRHTFFPDVHDPVEAVANDPGTPCADLPTIGQALQPAPRWVVVDGPGRTAACLLSGRWRLADLVDQSADNPRVTLSNGYLHVEYIPTAELAAEHVTDFHLRVSIADQVEAADPTAVLSGHTVQWTRPDTFSMGAALTASSRVVPLQQELAPWLVAALALLIIAVGLLSPRAQPAPVAPAAGDADRHSGVQPRMHTSRNSHSHATDPDLDSPWRPPR